MTVNVAERRVERMPAEFSPALVGASTSTVAQDGKDSEQVSPRLQVRYQPRSPALVLTWPLEKLSGPCAAPADRPEA